MKKVEERISEFEDRKIQIPQFEKQRKQNEKKRTETQGSVGP